MKGRPECGLQLETIDRLALPNHDPAPTKPREVALVPSVSATVAIEFFLPVLRVALWFGRLPTSRVSVPETAMNENHRSILRQHDVRRSGKIAAMKSKTASQSV